MGFTEQLKIARLSIGYTQQRVADIMGITKSTYCGYETGKRQPDVAKIKQLASALNTSGDFLLETGFEENQNDKLVSNDLTSAKLESIKKIKKMSDNEVNAILAFINSLESVTAAMSDKSKEFE